MQDPKTTTPAVSDTAQRESAAASTEHRSSPLSTAQLQQDGSPRQLAQRNRLAQLRSQAPPRNQTGLPDHLKSGIESLSGMDMSDVRVHRSSSKPSQLQAHAYAQGNHIHLAPGQEAHLPHEAWHVVQQRQGRVRPTMRMAGQAVNDDRGLEHEADRMGAQALQRAAKPREPNSPASAAPVAQRVVQRGAILNLAGITDAIETKANGSRFEDALRYAVGRGADPALINAVFDALSNRALENLPDRDPGTDWDKLVAARTELGVTMFDAWIARAGMEVLKLSNMEMLLSDRGLKGAYEQAKIIVAAATPLPQFAGVSYEDIVRTLSSMGYQRKEKYKAVSDNHDEPYGQDVWTSDDKMVVRIKVGGRSINGRFQRPPHVVKEVTKKAHTYAPADVLAKMTDSNVLIPAGTKYSAKDIQTWYNKEAGGHLASTAWKDPEGSGDAAFIELFKRWTEGAHTAIGDVPPVPTDLTPRQTQLVKSYRAALAMFNEFDAFVQRHIDGIAASRGNHPVINQDLATLSTRHRATVSARVKAAEDVVYESNFKIFLKKRKAIGTGLEAWKSATADYLSGTPPVTKSKPYFAKIFSDLKQSIDDYDTGTWTKLDNSGQI